MYKSLLIIQLKTVLEKLKKLNLITQITKKSTKLKLDNPFYMYKLK